MRAILFVTLGAVLLAGCESAEQRRLRERADVFVQHFQQGDESRYASLPGYGDTLQALAARVRAGEFAEKDGDAYAADLLGGVQPTNEYTLMRAFILRQQSSRAAGAPPRPARAATPNADSARRVAERARMRTAQWNVYARKVTDCVRANERRRGGHDSVRSLPRLNPSVDTTPGAVTPCPGTSSTPQL
jgi:hypothetical protein